MKRTYPRLVSDIIREAIEQSGQSNTYDQHRLCYLWSEVVGPHISSLTTRRYVLDNVLHVYIASAPLKEELAFAAPALVQRLNEAVGKEIIHRIIIH